MMKYLLVEDERFAYEEMKRMMEKLRPRLSVGGMDSHCGADRTISETSSGRSDVAGYPVDGWKQFRHF